MKLFLRVALIVLLSTVGINAAKKEEPIKISFSHMGGQTQIFCQSQCDAKVVIHISYRPENRRIEFAWDGDTEGGSSVIDLVEPDASDPTGVAVTHQVTFERWVKNLHDSVGIKAALVATDRIDYSNGLVVEFH